VETVAATGGIKTQKFLVAPEEAGKRVDRYLAARLPNLSRTRIQELIDLGHVRVRGAPAKRSHRVAVGETIEVEALPRPPLEATPEDIPLGILYEDDDIVVVDKPAGMAVHAGAGSPRGTLVNALLHRFSHLSSVGGSLRPGIVHRLDKSTSGALVVARNDVAHGCLAGQFRRRSVTKKYVALLHGRLGKDEGTIALPVARDLRRRTRMTSRPPGRGREARTDWRVLARLGGFTLVEARLQTGRTHQIRVHFSALGHPVVGDTLYGAPRRARAGSQVLPPLGRNFLHAAQLSFLHPRSGLPVDARSPLPAELREYLRLLAHTLDLAPGVIDAAARGFL